MTHFNTYSSFQRSSIPLSMYQRTRDFLILFWGNVGLSFYKYKSSISEWFAFYKYKYSKLTLEVIQSVASLHCFLLFR